MKKNTLKFIEARQPCTEQALAICSRMIQSEADDESAYFTDPWAVATHWCSRNPNLQLITGWLVYPHDAETDTTRIRPWWWNALPNYEMERYDFYDFHRNAPQDADYIIDMEMAQADIGARAVKNGRATRDILRRGEEWLLDWQPDPQPLEKFDVDTLTAKQVGSYIILSTNRKS